MVRGNQRQFLTSGANSITSKGDKNQRNNHTRNITTTAVATEPEPESTESYRVNSWEHGLIPGARHRFSVEAMWELGPHQSGQQLLQADKSWREGLESERVWVGAVPGALELRVFDGVGRAGRSCTFQVQADCVIQFTFSSRCHWSHKNVKINSTKCKVCILRSLLW